MDFLLGAVAAAVEFLASKAIDALFQRLRLDPRQGDVDHRAVTAQATRSLTALREGELRSVPENEWQAAVLAVRDSLQAAVPVIEKEMFDGSLRLERLQRLIEHKAAPVLARAGLGDAGRGAYQRILAEVSAALADYVRGRDEWALAVQERIRNQVDEVQQQVVNLPGRLLWERAEAARAFEVRYLAQLLRRLDEIELFGVAMGRGVEKYRLDDAYVGMKVARAAGHDRDYSGSGIAVADALAEDRRLLIRGGAGAGKTTLLRWLAVTEAGPDGSGRFVPIFLPLRRYLDRKLPEPDRMVLAADDMLANEMPSGWGNALLRSGRALVLVDGVDEVPADRRAEVRTWLSELADAYPDARYVVTTRPFAVETAWLSGHRFVTYDLLPMSRRGIGEYLAFWHDAAGRRTGTDEDERERLQQTREHLATLLERNSELRRLAGSPLLCGLICALAQKPYMRLPHDRKGIYEAALDLLLEGWDEQKHPHIGRELSLEKAEQLVLLQRLAYSYVRNQNLLISTEEAVRRIAGHMRGLRTHDADPEQVLRWILERTGVLREPDDDQVQFLHRTFRDYLAGREIADVGDFDYLLSNAHHSEWYDVVVMAVAHTSRKERDRILSELIARGNREPRIRDRLHLIAAACLEHVVVTNTNDVRDQVHEAAQRLIPPAGPDEAELLARAGSFVLELLPGPDGLSEDQAAAVIRAAALIGGPGAWELIKRFTDVPQQRVVEELLRAWRESDDPSEYAREVLADVDFGDLYLDRNGWREVRDLMYLNRLTAVAVRGDVMPLNPLAAISSLRRLKLMQNDVVRDLSPLAQRRSLRSLSLIRCSALRDLSGLAGSTVVDLSLFQTPADLSTLHAAPLRMLTVRHPDLHDGLAALPDGLPLSALKITNRAEDRRLDGLDRFPRLRWLSITGAPTDDDLAALAASPVSVLTVEEPRTLKTLYGLAGTGVRVLWVVEPPEGERVTELAAALRDVKVYTA
ncbi:NACHT domain-containing protein [Actinoplanes sp. NPDC024001]|uniref:NACHT domain-containing protein n=1 Tax=Actinoplanes sp. NPDC024001 TaxID=3154598 RepID=UPI003404A68B